MTMTPQEILNLLFSFFGGGVIAAIAAAILNNRSESRRRRVEFISLQLQELYGSLQFFTTCNEELFKLTDKLSKAYTVEYIDKTYSDNQLTQERLAQSTSRTLDLSNEYVRQVVQNNERILEILTNHYSLIDLADAEVFAQFIVDYTRHKTESGESGLRAPFEISNHLGAVSFMRPEFIEAVDKRFKEKQAELKKLLK